MTNQWLLLDIGNVFLVDEPLMALYWAEIYRAAKASGSQLSLEDIMALREDAVLVEGSGTPHTSVGTHLLGSEAYLAVDECVKEKYCADYLRYSFVHADAGGVLSDLSNEYSLAIAANQPKDVFREAMEEVGLLDFFQMLGISGDMGISKPSLDFFEQILAEIGVSPDQATMVGDRIDNDIAPAQSLGLKTVHVRMTPQVQGYSPTEPMEMAYCASLERAPSRGIGPGNEQVSPDVIAEKLWDIPDGVRRIC